MPNRIIKESICTSEEINGLSDEAECFFYRLLVNADDFGLFDARSAILKARCYPLKSIAINRIQQMLADLEAVGLILLYTVADKPYLQIISWEKHQQVRAKRAKFPIPADGEITTCNHLISIASKCPRNPIQSNPIRIQSCTEPQSDSMPAVIEIPLIGKTEFPVTQAMIDEWNSLYPAVDVMQTLREIRGWNLSNPTKRKTKSGVLKHINAWLAKEQNKGGSRSNGKATAANQAEPRPIMRDFPRG